MPPRHRFGSLLVAVACACVSITASAHAILVSSTPKVDDRIAAGHVQVLLKYNSKIDQHRSRLTLVGPDKREIVLPIDTDSHSNQLDTAADLAPGDYTLRWQALALDGHITRGDLPFTVVNKH